MTFTTRYVSRALLAALCMTGISNLSHAEETSTNSATSAPRTLAEATAQAAGSSAGRTDIVARVDSPRVTNILPWQEQPLSTPKNPLSISALDGSLNPTDRDRLTDETQYSRLLNQPNKTTSSNHP